MQPKSQLHYYKTSKLETYKILIIRDKSVKSKFWTKALNKMKICELRVFEPKDNIQFTGLSHCGKSI